MTEKKKAKWNTKNYIIGALRDIWMRHPTKLAKLQECRIEKPKTKKDGSPAKRPAVFYVCENCKKEEKLVKRIDGRSRPFFFVDHADPATPIDGFPYLSDTFTKNETVLGAFLTGEEDWNEYITRLFNEDGSNLQGLCKECHDQKTKEERSERAKRRWAKKKALSGRRDESTNSTDSDSDS